MLLLPGLADNVVLDLILPRLPSYTRPLLAAVSKAWRDALRNPQPYASLTRNTLHQHGIVFYCIKDLEEFLFQVDFSDSTPVYEGLFILLDFSDMRYHPLPSPPCRFKNFALFSVDGRLFALERFYFPKYQTASSRLFMLDLGAGFWHWEQKSSFFVPMSCSDVGTSVVGGKVYVSSDEDSIYAVYDTLHDVWEELPDPSLYKGKKYTLASLFALSGQTVALLVVQEGDDLGELTFHPIFRAFDATQKNWGASLETSTMLVPNEIHDLESCVLGSHGTLLNCYGTVWWVSHELENTWSSPWERVRVDLILNDNRDKGPFRISNIVKGGLAGNVAIIYCQSIYDEDNVFCRGELNCGKHPPCLSLKEVELPPGMQRLISHWAL